MTRRILATTPLLLLLTAPAFAKPVAVGVSEREFRIVPYRLSVLPGEVKFNIHNFGEDGHNLAVYSPRGKRITVTPELPSGENYSTTVKLNKPGRYRLVCTLSDHAQRGMKATLRVR